MRPGETVEIGPYQLTLEDVSQRQGPNYSEIFGRTTIRSGGVAIAAIEPAMRAYPSRKIEPLGSRHCDAWTSAKSI